MDARRLTLPLAAMWLLSPGAAHGDRAVSLTETLTAGQVQVGASLSRLRRSVDLVEEGEAQSLRGDSLDATLRLRGWIWRGVSLGLRQSYALSRATEGGEAPAATGFHDVSVDVTGASRWGRLRAGALLEAGLPTGSGGVGSRRSVLSPGAFGAASLVPEGELFAVAQYELSIGDEETATGDAIRASLGWNQRWERVSLVPSVTWVRNLGLGARDLSPSDVVRGELLVALEPIDDLTFSLDVEAARTGAHDLGPSARAGATELVAGLGMTLAWDTTPLARSFRAVPPPAAIHIADVSSAGAWEGESIEEALRTVLGELRRATLASEREEGGASGRLRVDLVMNHEGVKEVSVQDSMGAPAIAEAVRQFFLKTSLPAPEQARAEVRFALVFRP